MPPLSNGRHELFAQGLARGEAEYVAYKNAGFAGHRSSASRLLTKANIVARVAEIQKAAQTRTEETLESIVQELNEVRDLALRLDQPAAANGAIMGKAKLLGLEVDPRKNNRAPLSDVLSLIDGLSRGVPTTSDGETVQ